MRTIFAALLLLVSTFAIAQDSTNYTMEEIIYGRKDGMALTMIKMVPKEKAKGKAIVSVVSGNWVSGYKMINKASRNADIYLKRGYTVFLVIHGSQPRYAIPDAISDLRRAIRFIKYNAVAYNIDSSHIGITGSSSGGHLALMAALKDDDRNIKGSDPVDQVSSRVQAAAVFFPPTDFLNWGGANNKVNREAIIRTRVSGAFDFKIMNDSLGIYQSIKDDSASYAIAKTISPIYMVSVDDPPVMIIHGDEDPIVPLQQSTSIIKELQTAGVKNELIIKPGGSHGWRNMDVEEQKFVNWFDKWL